MTRAALLLAATLCGAGVMVLEVSAGRALAPAVGTSLFTWTNVIGVVLVCLAVGSWLGGRWSDRGTTPAGLAGVLSFAAILSLPAPFLTVPLSVWLLPHPATMNAFTGTPHMVGTSLAVTLLLFGPPMVLLGMVGPLAARCLQESGTAPGAAIGQTLAASTLGGLVGTYLPAHVLFGSLGVRGALLSGSGLLVAASFTLLARAPTRRALTAGMGSLALLSTAVFLSGKGPVRGPLDPPPKNLGIPKETELVREIESPYQYVRVSRWQVPADDRHELRLTLDEGVTEFHSVSREGSPLTGHYYDHFAVLPALFPPKDPVDVLILGGGAGTMAKLLREAWKDRLSHVVSVELDQVVLDLSDTFGWERKERDHAVVGDARIVLNRIGHSWQVIILDAYSSQVSIPFHLATVEFFREVRKRLAPGGAFALNVSTPDVLSPLVLALKRTLLEVFESVSLVSLPGSWNVLLLARRTPVGGPTLRDAPPILQRARREFLEGLTDLPQSEEGALLTDDRAPLEQLGRIRR